MQFEWLNILRSRWRALRNRQSLESNLEEELRFHLAMKTEAGGRDAAGDQLSGPKIVEDQFSVLAKRRAIFFMGSPRYWGVERQCSEKTN